jgi:SPX domain protein involved in polyphosphate accumulation
MLIIEDLKTRKRSWKSQPSGRTSRWKARPGLIVMKFGQQLRSSVIREYQWYYIDYEGLKDYLKHPAGSNGAVVVTPAGVKDATGSSSQNGTPIHEWTEDDESRFVSKLETELEKVHTKQQVKAMEISRRITVSEREVRDVVNRLNERGLGQEGPSEEEFMLLEEDLSDIIADVHDLAKFVQLNYTGFYKIIKKHDVSCGKRGSRRLFFFSPLFLSRRLRPSQGLTQTNAMCWPP